MYAQPAQESRWYTRVAPNVVEPLPVKAVAGLQRLDALDAHGPVLVAHSEREWEVVSERDGRGGEQREPGQRGSLDGAAAALEPLGDSRTESKRRQRRKRERISPVVHGTGEGRG